MLFITLIKTSTRARQLLLGFVLCIGMGLPVLADHITGGEMYYTFLGMSNGQYRYHVTVKLFKDCFSNRQLPNPAIMGIFDRATGNRVQDISVGLSNRQTLNLTNAGPCVTNPPPVCYEVGFYEFDVTLPGTPAGYMITAQVTFRINTITNLTPGYTNIGATYTGEIPGTASLADAPENNSAQFSGNDLVVVCARNAFSYSFEAKDSDGDQLLYSFCDAWQTSGGSINNVPPAPPPYSAVPYGNGFTGSVPLGGSVKINANTGLITGIAPSEGTYVVTVCVQEIRGGVVIATQRKDLQIKITDCSIAAASIPPDYMLCRNTQTVQLSNFSNSPLINTWLWQVFDRSNTLLYTSANATNSYTFADTGTYTIRLVTNRGQQCADSATAVARVYPGFIPDFSYTGICVNKPTQFTDATSTRYGSVNSWSWDFGEATAINDVSTLRSPAYTYPGMGIKPVRLIVTNTMGCADTLTRNINIVDKPPLNLAFRDTLICARDAVQLQAIGNGVFNWLPGLNILNANTPNPTVTPLVTTTYTVNLDDNGCVNKDSVRVRVVDKVNLKAMEDTVICQGDPIQLRVASDGLKYAWVPSEPLDNALLANPVAITVTGTTYEVTASIGGCSARDQVVVTTVAYPVAKAGPDTMICYQTTAQLQGSADGSAVLWSPANTLTNSTSTNPVASPAGTTTYILAAYDNKGCPKPGYDTMVVTVLPDIIPFAGRDTAVIIAQPLQLQATGGVRYQWLPGDGLSSATIADPVAKYFSTSPGISYKVLVYNQAGCVDSAYVRVKVFNARPSVFVPNAFTPNSDGRNDVIRPIAVGIDKISYFAIYNRWGQQVFSTTVNGHGWDGMVGGIRQDPGVFVWAVKAVDYMGKPYFQRGTVVLVR